MNSLIANMRNSRIGIGWIGYPLRLLLLFMLAVPSVYGLPPERTVIDEYVQREDPAYEWKIVSEKQASGYSSVVIELTSQSWLGPEEVTPSVWKHTLSLAIPERLASSTALLWIGGGNNADPVPAEVSAQMAQIAVATGSVVADLGMVPNQPVVFHDDGIDRYEDNLIAYTWDQFMRGGRPEWLARNAMVKSAVRAMDAVIELADQKQLSVDRFVVGGASKRGWTTWLTGAMDSRVVGIIPVVIDVANVTTSMRHHFEAYGYWALAIGDYVDHDIMRRFHAEEMEALYSLVDPLKYLHRLTMPKLIINASGDQFFLPDSSQFYWSELRGENALRYVPNADHSLAGTDVQNSIATFLWMVGQGRKAPQLTWHKGPNNDLSIIVDQMPLAATLWQAENPSSRDFRLERIGPAFMPTAINPTDSGIYRVALKPPEHGWRADFIEFEFDVGFIAPLKLTTAVYVSPDELPFAGKAPDQVKSITISCLPPAAGSSAILEQLDQALAANALKVGSLRSHVGKERLYFNYTPAQRLYAGAAEIQALLARLECEAPWYQLESGEAITLPPVQ